MQMRSEPGFRETKAADVPSSATASRFLDHGRCGAQLGGRTKTFRLAFGLFREIGVLSRVISDLAAQGYSRNDLCLLGRADCSNASHWNPSLSGDVVADLEKLQDLPGVFGIDCVASAGTLLDDLSKGTDPLFNWMPECQQKRVETHLHDGGLVLIVSSVTPAQQDAASRLLLRRSQSGVQTHDFTLRI